eukprot:s40_g9.t1
MQLRDFEKLPAHKEHSYEDDTTEPSSGSETGSERPRRNSQGRLCSYDHGSQREAARDATTTTCRAPYSAEAGGSFRRWPTILVSRRACSLGQEHWSTTRIVHGAGSQHEHAADFDEATYQFQGPIFGGTTCQSASATGSPPRSALPSLVADGYPGEGATNDEACGPYDHGPSAAEHLCSTLRARHQASYENLNTAQLQ